MPVKKHLNNYLHSLISICNFVPNKCSMAACRSLTYNGCERKVRATQSITFLNGKLRVTVGLR